MSDSDWSKVLEKLREPLTDQAKRLGRDELDAGELAQEVIVRCMVREPSTAKPLEAYARAILANLVRRGWSRRGRTVSLESVTQRQAKSDAVEPPSRDEFTVEEPGYDAVEYSELLDLVRRRTEALPDGLRQAAELRWFDCLGYREIAAKLGIDEVTARVRCYRARRQLLSDDRLRRSLGRRGAPGPEKS